MNYFLSIKESCIVVFLLLAGCHTTLHTESVIKRDTNALELSLFYDLGDGRLDMSLERACLIASGVDTEKKMRTYLTKIDLLISRISHDTDIDKTSDPLAKAGKMFDWLQKKC